jgi:alpha-L-fucosidase 2
MHISNATEIVLLLSAATSFNGFDKCPNSQGKDESALAEGYMNLAIAKSFDALRKTHFKDYQTYFNRVSFSLNDNKKSKASTTERLKQYASGASDSQLEAIYFHFGRYLLISCSREGGQPANLQGLWNPHVRPPWSSNYTININTQMNYWPAEVCNLSEMHQPLFGLIKSLAVTGAETTKNFYGLGGWTAHHNTDLWVVSNPVGDMGKGDPLWANWAMAGPWLTRHLYEHSLFTADTKFLRETAYPLMKGTAQFCLDWLVEDSSGQLVTAPSTTPENVFLTSDGKLGTVSQATTMDMSIIWDLFTNLIEASVTLGVDEEFRNILIKKRMKLYPLTIGKNGGVLEWFKDFQETEPEHRHVSHLFGLHPGRQISPLTTPLYAQAARKTLELRGDGGTGWSRAWKINFWARLNDGNHAYKMLRGLLRLSGNHGPDYSYSDGGTYSNLLCAHPPFQIDGNFGGLAGMTEMLLQSHLGEVWLLPAIPEQWQKGSVRGLRARGGFEVAMKWKEKTITSGYIQSLKGGLCQLRTNIPVRVKGVRTEAKRNSNDYIVTFNTEVGKKYKIKRR